MIVTDLGYQPGQSDRPASSTIPQMNVQIIVKSNLRVGTARTRDFGRAHKYSEPSHTEDV
jgi:hypothetical protein